VAAALTVSGLQNATLAILLSVGGGLCFCAVAFHRFRARIRTGVGLSFLILGAVGGFSWYVEQHQPKIAATVDLSFPHPVTTNDENQCPPGYLRFNNDTMQGATVANMKVGCDAKICLVNSKLLGGGLYNYLQDNCPK
jgi:hypothetical protein